jgi:hypothetical protein
MADLSAIRHIITGLFVFQVERIFIGGGKGGNAPDGMLFQHRNGSPVPLQTNKYTACEHKAWQAA